jgi:hypothetical protein
MEEIAPCSLTSQFIQSFNAAGGKGISSLKLPGLPHPTVLQLLVEGLGNRSPEGTGEFEELRDKIESQSERSEIECMPCFRSGWACYEGETCRRFSALKMVSITKDTVVGQYEAMPKLSDKSEEHNSRFLIDYVERSS